MTNPLSDRTKRWQAEQEVRRLNVSSILQNLPDPIFVKDAKTLRYVSCNRAAEDFTGLTTSQIIGRTVEEVVPGPSGQPLAAQTREALGGGQLLLERINEVLEFSLIESGRLSVSPEPVAVADVVQRALDMVRPLAAQIGIELDGQPALDSDARVAADPQRLSQVLLNLLSNAVKYNREGGKVTIACREGAQGQIRIAVTDTGAGTPPKRSRSCSSPSSGLAPSTLSSRGPASG